MAKLTDAHKEQCREMAKDGKRSCEIIDFFRETYRINLKSSTLNYILHGRKKEGIATAESVRRKAANKRYFAKKAAVQPKETEANEFISHIHAAWDIYKKDFIGKVEEILAKI